MCRPRIGSVFGEPKTTFAVVLGLDPAHYRGVASRPASALRTTVRAANCLVKADIQTLGQLLSTPFIEFWNIRGLGRGTLQDLANAVLEYLAGSVGSEPSRRQLPKRTEVERCVALRPLTLRDEWLTFSGSQTCPPHLDLPFDTLPGGVADVLQKQQFAKVEEILDLTLDEIAALLPGDGTEALLDSLLSLASKHNADPIRQSPARSRAATELGGLLAARWASVPIVQLSLADQTAETLLQAGICTLRQLLKSLDPLSPCLYLDLSALSDVWRCLVRLQLRSGEPLTARAALVQDRPQALTLDIVPEYCKSVCSTKRWDILSQRFGISMTHRSRSSLDTSGVLSPPLSELAEQMGLTRARVQQIERAAIRTVNVSGGPIQGLGRTLLHLVTEAGGILSLTDTVAELSQFVVPGLYQPEGICHLVYEVSPQFVRVDRGRVYALSQVPWRHFDTILSSARSLWRRCSDHIHGDFFVPRLIEELFEGGVVVDERFVRACLRVDSRLLEDVPRAKEFDRGLNALIADALRQIGRPAHFSEIASHMVAQGSRRRPVSARSVHGRLTAHHELFVYVERGTYGLAEWGIEDQRDWDRHRDITIADLIEEFLSERDAPATAGEVVEYVLTRKQRREISIRLCLSRDPRFHHFAVGSWGLKKWVI